MAVGGVAVASVPVGRDATGGVLVDGRTGAAGEAAASDGGFAGAGVVTAGGVLIGVPLS